MRRTRARGIALTTAAAMLASVSVLAQGQGTQTGSGTGVIAGRVVDAVTGQPVAGATVTLSWVTADAAASSTPAIRTPVRPGAARPGVQVTDDTGRFEYAGLTAGRFRLQVRGGPGYRWSYFGMQTPWDTATGSTQHELRSNEQLTDVVLKLWPGGSIGGTVRDEFGEPIVKASLRLFERQTGPVQSGWRRTTVSAETDDRGQFRLGDRPLTGFVGPGPSTLPGPGPGDYVIVVTAPRSSPGIVPPFAGAVFAPGTRSIAGAQIISLGVGEHRSGIDIVVPTKGGPRSTSVRGRIVNSSVLREPLQLRLVPADASGELANFLEITTTAGVDGLFTFPSVPAGEYRLKGWQFPEGVGGGSPPMKGPDPTTWMADVLVQVGADVPAQDIQVTLRPAARITGGIVFDGSSPPPAVDEVRVSPMEDHPDLSVGTIRTRVSADGRFATPGLLPGQYLVNPNTRLLRPDRPLELLWWPSSILMDGREVSGLVPVGASDVDIQITMTDRRAILSGTVRDSRGQVRPDARVVVFGRDQTSMEGCLRLIAPDRAGVYEHSWARGDCLFAAAIDPPRTWYETAYLETLAPFAVPARVELGERRTLDLTVRP